MIKRNPNIRKLAIAFAQGKLDLTEYRKLRTFQLSAIDFGKPAPELPPKLAGIEIPSINIDPPNKSTRNRSFKKFWMIAVVIAILAAAGGAAYYQFGMGSQPSSKKSALIIPVKEKATLTLAQHAEKMISKRIWTKQDIDQFKAQWIKSEQSNRVRAKKTAWYADLKITIKKHIDETKALINNSENAEADQALLDNLRLFYAYLETE